MRVAITGSTGLIGSALTHSLLTDGHQVVRLVRDRSARPAGTAARRRGGIRSEAASSPVRWTPWTPSCTWPAAGVGDKRWSAAYKEEIRRSRALGTRTIARACAESSTPPRVLVSASATGYYGDTGDRTIEESAPPGDDFLAAVCVGWEAAADTAREAGIRVVHPRTGLVVSAKGGAFGRLFPLFRFGLGGRLGSGDQYWPFISLTDHIGALRFAIDDETLTGPVNFTVPEPLTNREITRAMGRALHRPTIASVPAFALRAALGEFATGITGSCRAVPAALDKAGFTFSHPTIDTALRSVLHTS